MSEVYHRFTFPNGDIKYLSFEEAVKINEEWVFKRIEQIRNNYRNKRMNKDGFEPGWQPNINEYCPDRGNYDKRLKELGLVECGRDISHIKDSTTTGGYCESKEWALAARESGVELSDNEVEAIASGEFFKEFKPVPDQE